MQLVELPKGLSAEEVKTSRLTYGANSLVKRKRKMFLQSFFANFGDPMLKILLIALGIQIVFLFNDGSLLETFGIAIAILVAVTVSTVSEQGSEAAFEKLQKAAEDIVVRVRRDNKTAVIPIEEVVVGDTVLLGSGDKIPADGEIISGAIEVDQSVLNGESKDAKKIPCRDKKQGFLNEKLLFSGTVVTNGEGIMLVTHVGSKTEYGKIAAELQAVQPKSPLKVKLEKLAGIISIIGYIGAALVATAYFTNAFVINKDAVTFKHFLDAATLVVAVIVMVVPEGLPMMITVVLSSNMKNMLKDNVLVRKLNGVETAGSMNILFTDKTGTLTQGKLEVVETISEDLDLLGTALYYNTAAEMVNGRAVGGNFTDRILLEYSQNLLYEKDLVKTDTVPFNSTHKFMSTTVEDGRTFYKGAPEVIMPKCTEFFMPKQHLSEKLKTLTAQAYRLIAVAADKTFIGLIAIRDQIRPEAAVAVRQLHSASIQTVMITGDARETAVAIAREVGILPESVIEINNKTEGVFTSEELAALTDAQVEKILPALRVVARALPTDKSRLVRISQKLGLVAGMTGDGVNDAPALKNSDIGFAMGSGTEVAKEAGDIVILDDNIGSIVKATSYGRTIFKSIRKFLIFKLTINFVAMTISIFAPFIGIGTPITVLQMLWINLIMDTLAGLAFGGERPRQSYMQEPPKRRDEAIINKYMWSQIIYASVFIGALSLLFLKLPMIQSTFEDCSRTYMMTAFFAFFMFINILNSLNCRTHDFNPLSYISLNKPFVLIMGIASIAQVLLIFFGGPIFRTVPISMYHFAVITVLALTVIPADILRKVFIRIKYGKNIINT